MLRGPLFGLSDRDLFAFRQAGGYFSLFAEIETDDPGARRVADALATLRQWHKWTRSCRPVRRSSACSRIRVISRLRRRPVAASRPAISSTPSIASGPSSTDGFTLADAAEALAGWCGLEEDPTDDSTDVDSLPLEPGRSDVVRLMNLHKAKGLEAAVVFLADPNGGYRLAGGHSNRARRRRGARLLPPRRRRMEVGGATSSRSHSTGTAHEADEQTYLQAELDRLFYVAATRAKDLLVVGRYLGNPGKNPAWPVLTAALGNAKALKIPAAVAPAAPPKVDLSIATASRAAAEIETAAHERSHQAVLVHDFGHGGAEAPAPRRCRRPGFD